MYLYLITCKSEFGMVHFLVIAFACMSSSEGVGYFSPLTQLCFLSHYY